MLGGVSRLDRGFLRAVLRDAPDPLASLIDAVALHLRGPLAGLRARARAGVRFFRRMGVGGPLWITETGYPSEPALQCDPAFQGGKRDQARYLTRAPAELLAGGAARVFVTLRDGPEFGPQSAFSSEGVVRWPQLAASGRVIPKPAFGALRRLAAAAVAP